MPVKGACKSCGECDTKTRCEPYRGDLRRYGGSAIRFTADGFDCALPVSFDSFSACSFSCLYCFSNFMTRDSARKKGEDPKTGVINPADWVKAQRGDVGVASVKVLDDILAGRPGKNVGISYDVYREALNFGHKKRCPMQWGALGDPFDNIERNQGFAFEVMDVIQRHRQPTRISTKGGALIAEPAYLDRIDPELYWVAFSLITPDDELLSRIDRWAPNATQRLAAMKELSRRGVSTSLRFRPAMPGVSDSTPKHPRANLELIERAAEAGARSISLEVLFYPQIRPHHVQTMMDEVENIAGKRLEGWYKKTSVQTNCLRSSRAWKEDFMMSTIEKAKECGLFIGVSDPHFKEESESGCCCGIPDDDPIFGGWQRHNALEALLKAKRTGEEITAKDGVPAWAEKVHYEAMVCVTGPKKIYLRNQGLNWGSMMRDQWNNAKDPRGPLLYFEGGLRTNGKVDEDGDILYRYGDPPRKFMPNPPLWKFHPDVKPLLVANPDRSKYPPRRDRAPEPEIARPETLTPLPKMVQAKKKKRAPKKKGE